MKTTKTTKTHWTARSIEDYIFRIANDFIIQLQNKMESKHISQDKLAKKMRVTKGAVSQWINRPGNISLRKMIEYARALGMKVSVVAYEDGDPKNKKGPIDADIFRICWEQLGKPRDFWDLQNIMATNRISYGRRAEDLNKIFSDFKMLEEKKSTLGDLPGCPSFVRIGRFEGNKTSENIKPS